MTPEKLAAAFDALQDEAREMLSDLAERLVDKFDLHSTHPQDEAAIEYIEELQEPLRTVLRP